MNYGEIAAKVVWDGGTSVAVPKEMGEPRDDQLQGSPADKLSELSGRVCYQSCGSGRNSKEYHEHILKVRHLSVYGHYHFTIETDKLDLMWALQDCINRPGLWVRMDDATKLRVTSSLRTVLEWGKWDGAFRSGSGTFSRIQDLLINAVIRSAPTVACTAGLTSRQENWSQYQPCFVSPKDDEEKWVTMFLQCGRTASHEQVRHDFRVGTSQRSTRFCDEDDSPWVVHPLLMQALSELPGTLADTIDAQIENLRTASTSLYNDIVESLAFYLKSTGADRLSCRKQARGAARGFLPNNLQTQLIFSASVAQWKRMIEQRLTAAADAEIRDLYAKVLLALQQSRYGESFASYQIEDSPDGVGVCLVQ